MPLDRNTGEAQVSINPNPVYRGRGLSTEFLLLSANYFLLGHEVRLIARVRRDNVESERTFRNAGYEVLSERQVFLHLIFYSGTAHF